MKNVMGVIHHIKNEKALREITHYRCMAAVPFAGKYRLVDFVLSNMVNAGINNIGLMTSLNLRSLMDHLGSGREWGLDKKHGGLYFLPTAGGRQAKPYRLVDLQDFYQNLDYLEKSRQKYVLIAGSNSICSIDYREVFAFHLERDSDVTIVCKEFDCREYSQVCGKTTSVVVAEAEPDGKVVGISRKRPPRKENCFISLDMYLLKKELLLEIITECFKAQKWDLVSDILSKKTGQWGIYSYLHEGYAAVINSMKSYYVNHLRMLKPDVLKELFNGEVVIRTKWKDGPPAKYGEQADVRHALVANGCLIKGTVANSVLYRNVSVAKGAIIKNSVIMPKARIEEDAYLDCVILDKEVLVRKGAHLAGNRDHPVVVGKRSVI